MKLQHRTSRSWRTGAREENFGHCLQETHLHLLSRKLQMSLKELPGRSCTLVAEVRCPVRLAFTVCIQVCPQWLQSEVKR